MAERQRAARLIVAIIVVATCGFTGSPASAAQRQALCKLVVGGKTYINGQCGFYVFPDGSFIIQGKVYFAQVDLDGNTARWNEDPKSSRMDADLGTVTRNGACWENARTQICARNLPANKTGY